ncbi:MAG: hypothetical protein PHV21_08535 [Synergistaceae bacterium]|nr:hypothetical protein [Synergistaceae bacterium]
MIKNNQPKGYFEMEQKTESASCKQCRWYKPLGMDEHYGRCIRYAPHPKLGTHKWQTLACANWPCVCEQRICGDFKKK